MKRLQSLLIGGVLAAMGCAHSAAVTTPTPNDKSVASAPVEAAPAAPSKGDEQAMEDLQKMLAGEIIQFDFDRDDLNAESRARLQRIADILAKHPGLTIRIEGNCDERGGEEFNLQLGQKRAAVAKSYLVNLGVASARIDTISFGEDRPANPAHNEEAWTQNRRDDIKPKNQM